MKKLGKPTVVRPRYVDGPSAHFFQDHPVSTFDIHGHDGTGHRVESRGVDDGVDVERALRRLEAVFVDPLDRLSPQIDEFDVRPVECLVVVGVQARTLRSEGVVVRAERLGDVRIVHPLAVFLADQVGHDGIGREIRTLVGEDAENLEELPFSHAASNLARATSALTAAPVTSLGGIGTPPRDQRADSRYAARSLASAASRSSGGGPL